MDPGPPCRPVNPVAPVLPVGPVAPVIPEYGPLIYYVDSNCGLNAIMQHYDEDSEETHGLTVAMRGTTHHRVTAIILYFCENTAILNLRKTFLSYSRPTHI